MKVLEITKPTLVINEATARANIRKMAEKARRSNVEFVPHFKTHQSREVGEWFRKEGVTKITVSSVSMATYFANAGWNNITIAFPLNLAEIDKIEQLASKIGLTLLVVDKSGVEKLSQIKSALSIYIEIDAGYHRSGVECDNVTSIKEIISSITATKHQFKGFYCHSGNSYYARSKAEVKHLYNEVQGKLTLLAQTFKEFKPQIAIGDTPTCSIVDEFEGVHSIHPGNFVYYDVTQTEIGSCSFEDISTTLLCPVVMKNKERNELVIYGGGVHLSKEQLLLDGAVIYGLVSESNGKNFVKPVSGTYLKSLSQEHGVISASKDFFERVQVGDIVSIIPVHSCMMVDCMQHAITSEGKPISIMDKRN
ncbi:MAG: alanine racemase [Cyclobacteriaceae bacterium]|nr:alanine racemase [Cyclobacteriaceae bacterium]